MRLSTFIKKNKKAPTSGDFKKLKMLVTIVNRNKTEFFLDLLSGEDVNFQTSIPAQGTAGSETLRLLGLTNSDKSVLISIVREDKAEDILRLLDDKFQSVRGGKGIAFTIPLSSVIGVAIYRFLGNIK